MKGTCLVQCRKSMDMRYSRRDRPGPAGRQTCSWCRWLRQPAALAPLSIFPGCARPAGSMLSTVSRVLNLSQTSIANWMGHVDDSLLCSLTLLQDSLLCRVLTLLLVNVH